MDEQKSREECVHYTHWCTEEETVLHYASLTSQEREDLLDKLKTSGYRFHIISIIEDTWAVEDGDYDDPFGMAIVSTPYDVPSISFYTKVSAS